jgi:hypothetical protein
MPSLGPVYPERNIVLAHGGPPIVGPIVGPITALLRDHPRPHNGTAHWLPLTLILSYTQLMLMGPVMGTCMGLRLA